MSANPSSLPQRELTIDLRVSTDGTPTLVCRGRMVLEGATQFRAEVKNLTLQHKLLLADLSGVDFVDSSGLGSVLGTYIYARSGGCNLKLINAHPRVRDLLNITHLNQSSMTATSACA